MPVWGPFSLLGLTNGIFGNCLLGVSKLCGFEQSGSKGKPYHGCSHLRLPPLNQALYQGNQCGIGTRYTSKTRK
jgi:hypothetical protein